MRNNSHSFFSKKLVKICERKDFPVNESLKSRKYEIRKLKKCRFQKSFYKYFVIIKLRLKFGG